MYMLDPQESTRLAQIEVGHRLSAVTEIARRFVARDSLLLGLRR
jgi:hypothetical protein